LDDFNIVKEEKDTSGTSRPNHNETTFHSTRKTANRLQNCVRETPPEYEKYLHGQLGLYGYFILLADRFVKDGGRIAFVLAATVLMAKSAKGVRKLLNEEYCIEHIITAWERAAFSEGAQFREILLVAKKTKPQRESRCVITSLKKLPRSAKEAREYGWKIKLMTQTLFTTCTMRVSMTKGTMVVAKFLASGRRFP